MLNSSIVQGRLTKDPELKETEHGQIIVFIIAVPRNFKNKKNEYDADYINGIAKKDNAEYINEYGKKGAIMTIQGALRTGSYIKKGTKIKMYTTQIECEKVWIVGETKKTNNELPSNKLPTGPPF